MAKRTLLEKRLRATYIVGKWLIGSFMVLSAFHIFWPFQFIASATWAAVSLPYSILLALAFALLLNVGPDYFNIGRLDYGARPSPAIQRPRFSLEYFLSRLVGTGFVALMFLGVLNILLPALIASTTRQTIETRFTISFLEIRGYPTLRVGDRPFSLLGHRAAGHRIEQVGRDGDQLVLVGRGNWAGIYYDSALLVRDGITVAEFQY